MALEQLEIWTPVHVCMCVYAHAMCVARTNFPDFLGVCLQMYVPVSAVCVCVCTYEYFLCVCYA